MPGRALAVVCLATLVVAGSLASEAAADVIPPEAVAQFAEFANGPTSPLAQDRSVEPVVLEGNQFPGWSAGPDISAREPVHLTTNSDCDSDGDGNHNCSQASRIPNNPLEGVPVDRLLGYRWDPGTNGFVQIPFQVDERFTRYISNLASNCTPAGPACVGFGGYSGADPQLSYVYDREGYRFTEHEPAEECRATMKEGDGPEPDPVRGLDDNDELVFLYRDTGSQAPPATGLPDGVEELREVRIEDTSRPGSPPRFAYVALTGAGGPEAAYTDENGYIRYVRDATADIYEGTSDNYGNAPRGPFCDSDGVVIGNGPRRPRDTAWVLTPRYAFRYDGRWVLRGVRVASGDRDDPLASPDDYGPPLLDQWKARAYQQRPGQQTPCCGFQTEQRNYGRSSVLLGEKVGPVRAIRTTWGAESGTNTVRNELFYPDLIVQQNYLRVHPIPPLGGIFSYWDHTAGVVTKYYNPQRPEGVDVDGQNDEVFGTMYAATRTGGVEVRNDDDTPVIGPLDSRDLGIPSDGNCLPNAFCSDLDITDPTLQALGNVSWEQVSGPFGSMVFRTRIHQPGPGSAQSVFALPYYRDDSCFDDGTGIDPGPRVNVADSNEAATWTDPATGEVKPRECWEPEHGRPLGDPELDRRWFQGLIGAHGVQLLLVAESDNLFTTLPLTEIAAEERMVVLPPDPSGGPVNVGERYGHATDLPLVTFVDGAAPANQTTVTITGDTEGTVNHDANLEATLEDAIGPVAGATLHFQFQGFNYDRVTDAEGRAAVEVEVTGPAGTEDLVVAYDGDVLRSPASAHEHFEVMKDDSALGFTDDSAEVGEVDEEVRLAAELTDTAGPVGGAMLRFDFEGSSYEATTDLDGVAFVDVTVAGPGGQKTVTVSFEGDGSREPSSAEAPFTVESEPEDPDPGDPDPDDPDPDPDDPDPDDPDPDDPDPEDPTELSCGDEVSGEVTLTADLGPCPHHGLVVAGDLDLDLAGHAIRGRGQGRGLHLPPGTTGNVIVFGGRIQGFADGIRGRLQGRIDLLDLELVRNDRWGTRVVTGRGTVEEVVANRNGGGGLFLRAERRLDVSSTSVQNNGGIGLRGVATRLFVDGVLARGNDHFGILGEADRAIYTDSRLVINGHHGLVNRAQRAKIDANVALRNARLGIRSRDTADVRGSNTAQGNNDGGRQCRPNHVC